MEDSLQLPDDHIEVTGDQNIQTLLSPEPQYRDSRENTPPHSLAYSNSTYAKDKFVELHFRSPIGFDSTNQEGYQSPSRQDFIVKSNNENYPLNGQKTVQNSPNKNIQESLSARNQQEEVKIVKKGQYKKVNPRPKGIIKSPGKDSKYKQTVDRKNQQKIEEGVQKRKDHSLQIMGQQNQVHNTQRQAEQRKTIDRGQTNKLKKRVKQLQQALHMQTVISQQMRTKISVVSTLLESKLKQNNLQYFFNLKNSSRDMKNIDIFVEMSQLQKQLTEKNIIIERQKNQLREHQIEIDRIKVKKISSPPTAKHASPNKEIMSELQRLRDEKDELFGYIDEQKNTLTRKIAYIVQLEQQINRMGQKQSHYTNLERPKFMQELSELKMAKRGIEEDIEQMKMEFYLTEMALREENSNLKGQLEKAQHTLVKFQENNQKIKIFQQQKNSKIGKQTSTQKDDVERQILIKQLTFLKNQRDHYLTEYRKRTNDSAELYALQLKLSALQRRSRIE